MLRRQSCDVTSPRRAWNVILPFLVIVNRA